MNTNHVRFLSNNVPVCDKPKMLGYDKLLVDYSGRGTCSLCLQLVVAYNEKIDRYDLTLVTVPPKSSNDPNPSRRLVELEGLRAVVLGVSAFWIAVFLMIWMVWLR